MKFQDELLAVEFLMRWGNVRLVTIKKKTGCKIVCTELHRKILAHKHCNIL